MWTSCRSETVYGKTDPKRGKLAEPCSSSDPKRRKPAEPGSTLSLADHRDTSLEHPLPRFRDSDDGDNSDEEITELELSEHSSRTIVQSTFSNTLTNTERRRICLGYPHSGLVQTRARCPKLDPMFKTASAKSDAKASDSELARLQAFVLDAVGPLANFLNKLNKAKTPHSHWRRRHKTFKTPSNYWRMPNSSQMSIDNPEEESSQVLEP